MVMDTINGNGTIELDSQTVIHEGDLMGKVAKLSQELALYKEWVEKMTAVCEAAGRGDLEPRVIGVAGDSSPLGRLGRGINRMLDVTDAFVRESGASLEFAAHNKFFRRLILRGMPGSFRNAAVIINDANEIMAKRAGEIVAAEHRRLKLADDFETTVQGVISSVATSSSEMRSTAEGLARTSAESLDQVNAVATASEQTSANVRSVAAACEELTSSVGEITRQVVDAAQVSAQAVSEAKHTNEIVADLSSASSRIGHVAGVISKIAGTTNLLALNATIEAARAGEAGKGFAVVASEVKELARQTANATDEINREIEAIQAKTQDAVRAIGVISDTIQKIDKISSTIPASVSEQRSATNEISSNVQQAAVATQDTSRNVSGVSVAVQQTSAAAGNLLTAADTLTGEAGRLRTVADCFVQTIRKG